MERIIWIWLAAGFSSLGAGLFYGFIAAVIACNYLHYDDTVFISVTTVIAVIFALLMSPYMFKQFKRKANIRMNSFSGRDETMPP